MSLIQRFALGARGLSPVLGKRFLTKGWQILDITTSLTTGAAVYRFIQVFSKPGVGAGGTIGPPVAMPDFSHSRWCARIIQAKELQTVHSS